MEEKINALCDRIIAIYGFEHPVTIDFFKVIEEKPHTEFTYDVFELLVLLLENNTDKLL